MLSWHCADFQLHGNATGPSGHGEVHIKAAFRSPDAGEIGQPLLVRPVGLEIPVQASPVRFRRSPTKRHRPSACRGALVAPSWHQPASTRISRSIRRRPQASPSAGSSHFAPLGQAQWRGAPDAAGATGPVAGLVALLYHCNELCVMDLAGADRAAEPSAESGPRYLRHLAQPEDRSDVAMKANFISPLA